MKFYIQNTLLLLAILFSSSIFAQNSQNGSLNGILLDQDEVTVPFATVAVMKMPDSTVVTGTTTDIDGKFELKAPQPGDYLLRFSAIGYSSLFSSRFKVEDKGFSRDFGALTMREASTMLNEVMIETWRPKISMEGGNLNLKVEGTPLAAGGTAFEVLSRAPGVAVDQNGNFQLNGKSGVSILIDGRLTYLSQQELKTMLEGMPAENIESIEVITNPSAKYDAQGSSGILNIKLKENKLSGLNGSIYGGYEYNQIHGYNIGTNLNYKKGAWNSFLNFDLRRRGRIRDQSLVRGFSDEGEQTALLAQTAEDNKRFFTPSIRLGTDFSINENHTIGFIADLSFQDIENDWNSQGTVDDFAQDEITEITALNNIQDDFNNSRINLHYDAKLDTAGTTMLSANIDYAILDRDTESSFDNTYFFNQSNTEENEHLFSNTSADFEIFSARLDFSTAISESSQIELGLKASDVTSDSDLNFFIQEDGGLDLDPSRSNKFRYEENIYAAYASFRSKLSDNFNLNAGLRVEQTTAKGLSGNMDAGERDYLEWFPSISLEQKISKNYKLNYAYNRRILRPEYKNLNPFIFYIDPYTDINGNPNLQPQFTNSFQLTQTIMKKFHLVLGYDITDDYIGEIPIQDPETNNTEFAIRNMDNYTSLSATLVAPFQILPEWNVSNTLLVADNRYDISIDGVEAENDLLYYMAQSTHRVNLPSDLSLELNAQYQGPVAYGLYRIEDRFGLDLGIKKSFMNERLDVTLSADDIFRSMSVDATSDFNGNTAQLKNYLGNQAVSLNLRYNLSSQKENGQARQSKELEELNRAGG